MCIQTLFVGALARKTPEYVLNQMATEGVR